MITPSHKDQVAHARVFAEGRAGAKRLLTGEDMSTARWLWWPTLGGQFIKAGHFDTRRQALDAAVRFRDQCRQWLKDNTGGASA